MGIHEKIGSELQGFGGHLECESCGYIEQLGSTAHKLANGWPKCCGYTMRWWTQKELDARKENEHG